VPTIIKEKRPMNTQLKSILAQKLAKKGKKINGFTLIELMVVVAIVGVLSAVALPELTKAQNKAKSSAALTTAINAGKSCAVAIVVEDLASGKLEASSGTSFKNAETDCTTSASFVVAEGDGTSGKDEYTVTMVDGIPGDPVKGTV
jgi:type IV pilus assembly protein PilA